MNAWQKITDERRRQIEGEGWTLDHDNEHRDGQMLRAAVIYLHWGTDRQGPVIDEETSPRDGCPEGWPWSYEWWKPKDRQRNLIRAGALCLAERERLQRTAPSRNVVHVDHKLNLVLNALAEFQ